MTPAREMLVEAVLSGARLGWSARRIAEVVGCGLTRNAVIGNAEITLDLLERRFSNRPEAA